MENTTSRKPEAPLLEKAKNDLAADMENRGIGAIIWDNSTAGFHFIPTATAADGKAINVAGLYNCKGELYLISENCPCADIDHYYNRETEVKPTVVCLTANVAEVDLGDPADCPGFVTAATLEEWLAIADCYFEALNER